MHTDPIADMLTRIRNAQAVRKSEVVLPYSKIKFNILKLLAAEGWIKSVEVLEPAGLNIKNKKSNQPDKNLRFQNLKVEIKYKSDKTPKIKSLTRISKPGCRIYVNKDNLPVVLNNWGIAVISTSRGLMTNKQARKEGLGGEVLFSLF